MFYPPTIAKTCQQGLNKKGPKPLEWVSIESLCHHMTSSLKWKLLAEPALSVRLGEFQPFWWLHRNAIFLLLQNISIFYPTLHPLLVELVLHINNLIFYVTKRVNLYWVFTSLRLTRVCVLDRPERRDFKWGCSTAPKGQPTFAFTSRFSFRIRKLERFGLLTNKKIIEPMVYVIGSLLDMNNFSEAGSGLGVCS